MPVFSNTFVKTSDGGFAISGNIVTELTQTTSNDDAFILKTDSLGNELWFRTYGYDYDDMISVIIQTQDNGYIISGSTKKNGNSEWYIVRTDSVGNQIWDWVLPNPQNLSDGAVADLIQTQDGNFVAVGGQTYTCDGYCFNNSRLLKFDINKNILFDTLYLEEYGNQGETDTTKSSFIKIKQKQNGDFLVINYHQAKPGSHAQQTTNLYVLDNNFNLKTKREFRAFSYVGNSEYIKDFIVETDGSLVMIGDINSYGNTNPSQQVWFVKTDANYCDGFGSCDTIQRINFINLPDSISKNDTLNINFEVQSIYNINYNIKLTICNDDFYYIKNIEYYNIAINTEQNFSISYNNLVDSALFGAPVTNKMYIYYELLPSDSSRGAYRSDFREVSFYFYTPEVGIKEITKPQTIINIYPNPTKNTLFLEIKNKDENKNKVFIYDIYGRVVKQFKIQNSKLKIQVKDLEKGVYFVKVGSAVGKFVKE